MRNHMTLIIPKRVRNAIDRFEKACMEWGWQKDQGHLGYLVTASEKEFEDSRKHLEKVILSALKGEWARGAEQ